MPLQRPAERLDRGEPAVGRRAPADRDEDALEALRARATAISSPVPRVLARSGSLRPATSASPLARAISMTAMPAGSTPHSASTGSPSGPVTRAMRREPPRAASSVSSVPSPPSASGSLRRRRRNRRAEPGRDRGGGFVGPAACRGTCRDTRRASEAARGNRLTASARRLSPRRRPPVARTCAAARQAPRRLRRTSSSPERSNASGSWPSRSGARGCCTSTRPRTAAASPSCSPRTSRCSATSGIEAEWQVIHGSDEFFAVTKTVHNALQGADVEWTTQMERIYLERVLDNALQLEGEWDYVVMHDPQPAAMREYVARPRRRARRARSGSGAATSTSPTRTRTVWEFFRPFVEQYDASVWTMPQFVPDVAADGPHRVRAAVHRPALGEEPRPAATRSSRRSSSSTACAPHDPLIVQVSRFDPWKDPIGVIEAFRIVREEFPTRSSCSRARWRPTTPRASTTGSSPTRRAPATPTSTSCRTSSRSARCRSTRSSARPTS